MPKKTTSNGVKLEIFTSSFKQTQKAGKLLAKEVLKNKHRQQAFLIALVGDLGGGKTTFLQGLAKGLGVKEKVLSPTFIIMRKFEIRNPKFETNSKFQIPKFQTFHHIDCYRIKKPKEILDLGFKEIISDPKNIVVVEWADRVSRIIPKGALWLSFEFVDKNKRKIVVESKDDR